MIYDIDTLVDRCAKLPHRWYLFMSDRIRTRVSVSHAGVATPGQPTVDVFVVCPICAMVNHELGTSYQACAGTALMELVHETERRELYQIEIEAVSKFIGAADDIFKSDRESRELRGKLFRALGVEPL